METLLLLLGAAAAIASLAWSIWLGRMNQRSINALIEAEMMAAVHHQNNIPGRTREELDREFKELKKAVRRDANMIQ